MSRIAAIPLVLLLVLRVFAQPSALPQVVDTGLQTGPLVLVFVPQQLFEDDELDRTLRPLGSAGVRTRIVTADTTVAVSMNRTVVKPDFALRDVRPEDFDGLVLIGGSGAALYWDDSLLHVRCRDFVEAGKVVAAIGIAPIILARAGVLAGRKATVFRDRAAIGYIKEKGARYNFKPLVIDRNIITASDAEQGVDFSRAVARSVYAQQAARGKAK
jgi:protease I